MSTATLPVATVADEAAILDLIHSLAKAHHDKDAAAIAAHFAPDAAIYNLAPPLIHHGIDLEEKHSWLDTWQTPVEIEPRDFSVKVSGDQAVAYGYMRLSGRKKGAGQDISFWMRVTVVLARAGASWSIGHEHQSVPFYMDGSLRPAFDLEP
jgi:ketosteroid isomerase-like protein